jgi:hypothetical protein
MPETRVVNVRTEICDIYIGREHPAGYARSKWANRYMVGRDGDREECIALYEADLRADPEKMRQAVRELSGKRLGCWCAPAPCHGDVLVQIIEEAHAKLSMRTL